jgi:hypothetical protein
MTDLQNIQRKIGQARAYAELYFNADQEEDHLLAPPTFYVEFPDVDRMVVCKRNYGQRMLITTASYRLAFLEDGSVEWRGKLDCLPEGRGPIGTIRIQFDDGKVVGWDEMVAAAEKRRSRWLEIMATLGE